MSTDTALFSARTRTRLGACLVLLALACSQAWAQAGPKLPVTQITAGIHVIRAEVADDMANRAQGLMFREKLGPNEGMLFVFTDKSAQCFWMRNTLVPLSIAFLEDDGTVVNIADMAPKSDDSHCSKAPVRFALEMEQGWFAKRGIRAGDRLRHPTYFKAAAR